MKTVYDWIDARAPTPIIPCILEEARCRLALGLQFDARVLLRWGGLGVS